MYDTILFPTDGSPAAERLLEHVVPLAKLTDATVIVLYVVDTRVARAVGTSAREEVLSSLRDDAGRALARVTGELDGSGVDYVTEVREAHPHRGILHSAEENDVDVIVMGTRGADGDDRPGGVGSVTQRVVDSERRPVLVINVAR